MKWWRILVDITDGHRDKWGCVLYQRPRKISSNINVAILSLIPQLCRQIVDNNITKKWLYENLMWIFSTRRAEYVIHFLVSFIQNSKTRSCLISQILLPPDISRCTWHIQAIPSATAEVFIFSFWVAANIFFFNGN